MRAGQALAAASAWFDPAHHVADLDGLRLGAAAQLSISSIADDTRPCVVISPEDMNAHLRTVIVAPMTTGSRPARLRIALTFRGQPGLIVLDQIRTLDRVRLVKRLGALRAQTLALTLQTLQNMFAP